MVCISRMYYNVLFCFCTLGLLLAQYKKEKFSGRGGGKIWRDFENPLYSKFQQTCLEYNYIRYWDIKVCYFCISNIFV